MRKIPTIFVRDWEGLLGPPARFVTREPHPDAAWVFAGEGVARQKLDGACCLVRAGALFKRHEVKPGKPTPDGFEEVERDEETGAVVGWVPVGGGPEDRWHREAWDALAYSVRVAARQAVPEGTYELLGPKVQGNPEQVDRHVLVRHADARAWDAPRDYDALKAWFGAQPAIGGIEGIVWHHPDGRMAKVKGKDFGIRRAS